MGYLWQTEELICYDVINPTQYVFHDDTETFTLVYTEYCEDYAAFYANALQDAEKAKKTREYGLDMENHPNWFDASCIPWLSYDSLHIELPDGYCQCVSPAAAGNSVVCTARGVNPGLSGCFNR